MDRETSRQRARSTSIALREVSPRRMPSGLCTYERTSSSAIDCSGLRNVAHASWLVGGTQEELHGVRQINFLRILTSLRPTYTRALRTDSQLHQVLLLFFHSFSRETAAEQRISAFPFCTRLRTVSFGFAVSDLVLDIVKLSRTFRLVLSVFLFSAGAPILISEWKATPSVCPVCRVMIGAPVTPLPIHLVDLSFVCVKVPVFSFARLRGCDPVLGVEMRSTGEVSAVPRRELCPACFPVDTLGERTARLSCLCYGVFRARAHPGLMLSYPRHHGHEGAAGLRVDALTVCAHGSLRVKRGLRRFLQSVPLRCTCLLT